jgi:hypothetical protein
MSIDSPKKLYKFGKTTFVDVLDRYKVETHQTLDWRGVPLAQDYWVRVLWSNWVTEEKATEAEQWFQLTYPKTFYCTTTYNGITECRDWTSEQSYAFYDTVAKKFPKSSLTKETTHKIYYIMLTKK